MAPPLPTSSPTATTAATVNGAATQLPSITHAGHRPPGPQVDNSVPRASPSAGEIATVSNASTRQTSSANNGNSTALYPAVSPAATRAHSRRRLHHVSTGRPVTSTAPDSGASRAATASEQSGRRSRASNIPGSAFPGHRGSAGSVNSAVSAASSSSGSSSSSDSVQFTETASSALNHLQSVSQAFFNLRQYLSQVPPAAIGGRTAAATPPAGNGNAVAPSLNNVPPPPAPHHSVANAGVQTSGGASATAATVSRGASTGTNAAPVMQHRPHMHHGTAPPLNFTAAAPGTAARTQRSDSATATDIFRTLNIGGRGADQQRTATVTSRRVLPAPPRRQQRVDDIRRYMPPDAAMMMDEDGDDEDDDEDGDEDEDYENGQDYFGGDQIADDVDDIDDFGLGHGGADSMAVDSIGFDGARGQRRDRATAAVAARLRSSNGPRDILRWYRASAQNNASVTAALDNDPFTSGQLGFNHHTQAPMYSHFRYKTVCHLDCRHCSLALCERGMKAILLADTKVELYSTDAPPLGSVQLVNDDYRTDNCNCRIQDMACLGCGNVVGYHVTQPCESCLDSCNNGHFWMFQVDAVSGHDRHDESGTKPLLWAFLSPADVDRAILERRLEVVAR